MLIIYKTGLPFKTVSDPGGLLLCPFEGIVFNFSHPKPLVDGRAQVVQVVRQAARPALMANVLMVEAPSKKGDGLSLFALLMRPRDKV
jgi:hypothetical protein